MSATIIWVDREHAKFFEFSREKMERRHLQARHPDHHTHAFDELDHKRQERHFFTELAGHLAGADHVLILGPGIAKHHFHNFLQEHFPAVGRRVIGCETVDHPTDPQIAAYANRFFRAGT